MTLLEPIAVEHAAALQPLLEDPAISETTPFPYPYPPDGAKVFIAEALTLRQAGTKYSFAVIDGERRPVGVSMLKHVDRTKGEAELGYWIGRAYWGQGHATAAAAATLDFAFDTLQSNMVRAVCLDTNLASLRVLEKLGFAVAGHFMQSLPKWIEPRPSTVLELSSTAWRAR